MGHWIIDSLDSFKHMDSFSNETHNHPRKAYLFSLCINLNFEKLTLKTGFVVQGHI